MFFYLQLILAWNQFKRNTQKIFIKSLVVAHVRTAMLYEEQKSFNIVNTDNKFSIFLFL